MMEDGTMKSHARAVVIGGGVVGASVLFHLARSGWTDIVLVERSELTSGSTWHAAGGMHTINADPNISKLQRYTIGLYREIEQLSGQSTGLHLTGSIMLAATAARMDWLRGLAAKGQYLGIHAEVITPEEAHGLMPLMDPGQFVGAVWSDADGHLDPSGVTHAYAKAARGFGATVETHCAVEAIERHAGGWVLRTSKGAITCDHVVNAAGLWAREVGRMVGIELPVLAMEHMYLLTEDMPEVHEYNQRTGREIVHVVDFDGELYLRQERGGMLLGTYERACVPWSERNTPWEFGNELLPPDLDRIAPSLEIGFRRFPAFGKTGIKQVINGPFTFAPDGNPLVGPVRGLPGFWCACGVMAGFSQGGGVGLALSNWMVDGDPGADVFAMDVARFGEFATIRYTNAKVRENYARRFSIRYPNEELPAARPLKTSPIHDRLKERGAVFGAAYGLEVPLWFAPEGVRDGFSWRRSTDFEHVAAEVRAVRENVGIIEISGSAKYFVSGPDAEVWLDRMLACRIPVPGRMTLAPMLKPDGRLIGDLSLARLGQEEFLIFGPGVAEEYHTRWFEAHLPERGVTFSVRRGGMTGLSVAGSRARDLLRSVSDADLSPEAFRFMDIRRMDVAMAPALVGRVSFTGDLGYEIWLSAEYQRYAYDVLTEAGASFGIRDFGLRALDTMRLEKGFGCWAREYRPIYTAEETGLERFVALDKDADFIGKAEAMAHREDGGKLRLRVFVVDAVDADAVGDEPIWQGDSVVGWVTSGGYAHHSGKSVALGYVPREMADTCDGWRIELLGELLEARLQPRPLFDPEGVRMRS